MQTKIDYSRRPLLSGEKIDLCGEWELTDSASEAFDQGEIPSDWSNKLTANVPGTVQTALVEAGRLPDPYFGKNNLELNQTYQRSWWFRRSVCIKPEDNPSTYKMLVFHGLEYESRVWLNGKELGSHEGMFGGPVFEISDQLAKGGTYDLVVGLAPPPLPPVDDLFDSSLDPLYQKKKVSLSSAAKRINGKIVRRYNDITGCGWAYPQSYTCGIWQKVEIVSMPQPAITDAWSWTEKLSEDHSHAIVGYEMEVLADCDLETQLVVKLSDSSGKLLAQSMSVCELRVGDQILSGNISVEHPPLWWPNGLGPAQRCKLCWELKDKLTGQSLSKSESLIGIRKLERIPTSGPKTRYPWRFVVNGRDFFVRGFNWVPTDSLRNISYESYDRLLDGMKATHANLVRVWGWGGSEDEYFYDLCDKLGILVAQDFPVTQAKVDDENLHVLEQQAEWMVRRLRGRACMAQWIGGNELHLLLPDPLEVPLDFLEKQVPELDPSRLHQRTSPYGGDLHYGQLSPDDALNVHDTVPIFEKVNEDEDDMSVAAYGGNFFQWIDSGLDYSSSQPMNFAFVSETVFPTVLGVNSLSRVIPPEELERPVVDGSNLEMSHPNMRHHADLQTDWFPYIWEKALEYGQLKGRPLKEIISILQWPQAIRYQYMAGGYRSNYPRTGGFLFWVFNTPWPIGTWEVMDYYGIPNPAFYLVRRMFSPLAVAARFETLYLAPEEILHASICVMADDPQLALGCTVRFRLLGESLKVLFEQDFMVPSNFNEQAVVLGKVDLPMKGFPEGMLTGVIEIIDGGPSQRAVYPIRLSKDMLDPKQRDRVESPDTGEPPCDWPTWMDAVHGGSTSLSVERKEKTLVVTNKGEHPAWPVTLNFETPEKALPSDNHFLLWPGESHILNSLSDEGFPGNVSVESWDA